MEEKGVFQREKLGLYSRGDKLELENLKEKKAYFISRVFWYAAFKQNEGMTKGWSGFVRENGKFGL